MLVCRIELWPVGNFKRRRTIGTVVIANDATGTAEAGNYSCALAHAEMHGDKPGAWRGGRVVGHLRKLSPYKLVHEALAACLNGRRNKKADDLVRQAELGQRSIEHDYASARDDSLTAAMLLDEARTKLRIMTIEVAMLREQLDSQGRCVAHGGALEERNATG